MIWTDLAHCAERDMAWHSTGTEPNSRDYIVMADIVMAYVVMAYIVMAYIAMAFIVMAYIVMAYIGESVHMHVPWTFV